jgi:hypothetical protein
VTSLRPTNAPEETALGRSTPAWEIRRRTTCRLCDDVHLRLLFSLVSTPLANALVDADRTNEAQPVYPLDVHFCDHCFHVQLLDVVNPEILFRDYVYVSGTSPSFVDHFRRYAEDVLARTECTPGQLVVDIGSNDGTLLRFFKDKGCRVLGIEPATLIAERADAAGIETISAFLNEEVARAVARDYGSAAIVYLRTWTICMASSRQSKVCWLRMEFLFLKCPIYSTCSKRRCSTPSITNT